MPLESGVTKEARAIALKWLAVWTAVAMLGLFALVAYTEVIA